MVLRESSDDRDAVASTDVAAAHVGVRAPAFESTVKQATDVVRVAATGDLHCPRTPEEELQALFHEIAEHADVLLLCGDLIDYGKPEEARQLVRYVGEVRRIPILAV